MKNMTLRAIAEACGGTLHYDDKNIAGRDEAECVVIDSRKIVPGGVFIATKGERVDGHSFISSVFEKGALGVVCEKLPDTECGPCILVEDSFRALSMIAAYYRTQLDCKVIGITGSVGKTSTKEFVATVLAQKYKVCKTQGNFNNEVGMPLTILSAREDDEVLVLEMGINHFGEMERMAAIARPDMAVITNIANCHIEFLGDRDGVLKAKTAIFTGMKEGSPVFLNRDDDKLSTVTAASGMKPVFYGIESRQTDYNKHNAGTASVAKYYEYKPGAGSKAAPEYYVSEYMTKGLMGTDAVLVSRVSGETIPVSIRLPGEHMLYNALAATAVAESLDMTPEGIAEGIAAVEATAGRGHIVKSRRYTLIDDCYNANPSAMKSAIKLLSLADTRKVAILGDMFELGENAAALHREVGEYAGRSSIDMLLCVGELSMNMYEGALTGLKDSSLALEPGDEERDDVSFESVRLVHFKDKESLKDKLPAILHIGDSILIKASHGMGFTEIVDILREE